MPVTTELRDLVDLLENAVDVIIKNTTPEERSKAADALEAAGAQLSTMPDARIDLQNEAVYEASQVLNDLAQFRKVEENRRIFLPEKSGETAEPSIPEIVPRINGVAKKLREASDQEPEDKGDDDQS